MYRRLTDNIFAEKPPAELSKPYHEYGKAEILEFARREKASCLKIMNEYSSKLEELTINAYSRTEREEFGSCKGITLNRGIYHQGDGFELAVSNIGRGHRLKKAPEDGSDYYCYSFDKNDNLLCTEKLNGNYVLQREFIIRENEMEYGLVFREDGLNHIYAAGYNGSRLCFTYRFDKLRGNIADVCLYEYDDAGRRSSVVIVFNEVNSLLSLSLYNYEYDEDNALLGLRSPSGGFISVKGRNTRKYITASKITEAMKKILSEWDGFPDDVYALSVYFEDNESNDTSSFYIGFNTEAAAGGCNADEEARWNYAFWLQNDKPLFGEKNDVYVRYIENCGSLAVLSNAVKQLHKSGIITELFGRELPVIIHELEYYPEIAEYNIRANGKKLLPKKFIEFCGGIL
ncbi:MAG: hypothetical protein J6A37_15550 [Oscillospiraceae bacterium]|nr:hypothetical protein [Oscillospiraceae bacterium]